MGKYFNVFNFYMLLWIGSNVQDLFYESSLLSMVFYIPFLAITLFFSAKSLGELKSFPSVLKNLFTFAIVMGVYGFFFWMTPNTPVDNKSFLMTIIRSILPIFVFLHFSRSGYISEKNLRFWIITIGLVAILSYIVNYQNHVLLGNLQEDDSIVNNEAYIILALFPAVWFFQKTLSRYVFVAIIGFFAISGMKRGAMLIFAVLLIYFLYNQLKGSSGRLKLIVILLTLAFLVVGWNFLSNIYISNSFFQARIESTIADNTSGRNDIYGSLWSYYINDASLLQQIFGSGIYHTMLVPGTGNRMAHNDWLELLVDCGALGAVVYLFFWVSFYKYIRKSNSSVRNVFWCCFIFMFMRTLFSMSFTDIPFCICMILGFIFSNEEYLSDSRNISDYERAK